MAQGGTRQDSRGHMGLELWWGQGGCQLLWQDEVGSGEQSQRPPLPREPGAGSSRSVPGLERTQETSPFVSVY